MARIAKHAAAMTIALLITLVSFHEVVTVPSHATAAPAALA